MTQTHALRCLLIFMLVVGLLGPPTVTASSYTTVVQLWVGVSIMSIGGVSQPIDAEGTKPVIVEARTLVPIRAVIEAFDGSVAWDATERKVTVTLGKNALNLWIGKSIATLNGTTLPVDAANPRVMPVIMAGRTMLPVRFVSESLGIDVQYEAATKMITLTYTVETTPPRSRNKGPAIWPGPGYDTSRTGQCPYDTSANDGTLKWKFKTLAPALSSPVIASDGTVYVGSYPGFGHGLLYALNPDGTLQWKYGQSDQVGSGPAIAPDGTIYLGWSGVHNLCALNPDGTLRWKFVVPDWVDSPPAIAPDGTIYAGSDDDNLYAVNPDGTRKWKFATRNDVEASPTIASDGTVYVGSRDGCLYAVNPDGTLKWKYQTRALITATPSIASDGTIYAGSTDKNLYALDPDGALRWKFETGDAIQWVIPAIASDGTVYVGSYDHYLYAINPEGTLRWKFEAGGPIDTGAVISSDGTIYVGAHGHYLYAINPDGALRWKFGTDTITLLSSPAISSDGTIYVGANDGYLYALGGK